MDALRASALAQKHELDIDDWLDITDLAIGQFGAYRIECSGVYFHPNEKSDIHGWSLEQIQKVGAYYDVDKDSKAISLAESKAKNQRQMRRDNESCIHFPCTPWQLLLFFESDVSGDLFGVLPETFDYAVRNGPPPKDQRSDSALGAAVRQQRKEFAHRKKDGQEQRQAEYQRWINTAHEIQSQKTRQITIRQMGDLVKESLDLPESGETIRKHLADHYPFR